MSGNALGKGISIIEDDVLIIGEQEKGKPFVEKKRFPLVEVSKPELIELKKYKIPIFVMKEGDRYWIAKIRKNTNVPAEFVGCTHKCANSMADCERLSAASDMDGGCAKVRGKARNIERYPFVKKGFETNGNLKEMSVIVECCGYKKDERRPVAIPILRDTRMGNK